MITNAPERIWLNYGDLQGEDADHNECVEVSWSDHRVFNDDVEYVRSTPAEIMAAHPKCGECRHWLKNTYEEFVCFNEESRVHLDRTDEAEYCNKWEAK